MTAYPNGHQDTVYALARASHNVYAARASGLYRSQDGGTSWHNTFLALDTPEPLATTAVITAAATVWAGANGAVLRSDDGGENWHIAGLASPPPLVVALAVSPACAEDGAVFAGTAQDGVFVSTDRGLTWTAWNFGLIDHHVYALVVSPDFARDHTIFAGTESGIFRSHTAGRSWRETPFPMEAAPVLSLEMSPDTGILYAGTEHSGLFASSDSGVTWRQIEHEFMDAPINAIHVSAQGICLLLEDKLLWSADAGKSWERIHSLPPDKLAMAMLLDDALHTIIVGFADGDILQVRRGLHSTAS